MVRVSPYRSIVSRTGARSPAGPRWKPLVACSVRDWILTRFGGCRGRTAGRQWPALRAGRGPPPALADPEVVVNADVLDAVVADPAPHQGSVGGTRHRWPPHIHGMAPGRARGGPGLGAQRLWWR